MAFFVHSNRNSSTNAELGGTVLGVIIFMGVCFFMGCMVH